MFGPIVQKSASAPGLNHPSVQFRLREHFKYFKKPKEDERNRIYINKSRERLTKAREIRKVMTTGKSLLVNTSAAESRAKATPCLPSQHESTKSDLLLRSLMYIKNRVESVSCIDALKKQNKTKTCININK
jgi:hypothetical protein